MEISVIIPIYNGEKTIEACLDSVLKQTFENFEVVLMDDGSADATCEKCKNYQEVDSRIKYYYQPNAGVASARNNAIKKSKGKFITFIDADDSIDEKYLEILYNRCIGEQADISICDVIVEEFGEEKRKFSCNELVMSNTEAIEKLLSREGINSGPYAKLFERRIVENLKFPSLKTYEDILFVLYAFENAAKIVSTSRVRYHYIVNPKGAMHNLNILKSEDIIIASEEIVQYLCKNKKRFTGYPFYITVSHVMQYIQEIYSESASVKSSIFMVRSYEFMKKFRKDIFKNKKFPFKEKLVYLLMSYNLKYCGKMKFRKMCNEKSEV